MKGKIIIGFLMIVLIIGVCKCEIKESEAKEENNRLVTIYKQENFSILVDTRTNVEYLLYANDGGFRKGGAGGMTVLLNQDGTPLLYGGSRMFQEWMRNMPIILSTDEKNIMKRRTSNDRGRNKRKI